MFEAVQENGKSLAEMVSNQILQLIADQNLSCGEKLPNEFELAELLKVGRGTVREAVKLLISRNVLEIRRGKGTFVTQKPGIPDDPLGLAFYRDKYKLTVDLSEIRMILEPEIAFLAARRALPDEIEEMKRLCAEVEMQSASGKREYIALDVALHTCIAKSTHNLVIPNLIPMIHNGIEMYNQFPPKTSRGEAIGSHGSIIAAIEAHDSDGAKKAMIRHLTFNLENLEAIKDAAAQAE